MSSTSLPSNEKRLDFYRTPAWATEAIAPKVISALKRRDRTHNSVPKPDTWRILDAGAGDGAIVNVLARSLPESECCGVECNATQAHDPGSLTRPRIIFGDFLRNEFDNVHAVVMNPPFSQSIEFVTRAIEIVRPVDGVVFALLRLAWMAGLKRTAFHRENPSNIYVLPRRPSFTGGGTDSADYAWFAWVGPESGGRWEVLEVPA